MGLGDLPAEGEADARSVRLRREERDEQVGGIRQSPPLVVDDKPALEGIRIAAMWNPASGFGGDCYDVIRFSDERVGVTIADVAGKGLPAALLMSNLQAAVRAFASDASTPQQVATSVNRLLCRNIAVGRFVSFCYLVIDRAQGLLTFANAGHNPPLLVRGNGTVERLMTGGMVLGVMPDSTYEQHEVAIGAGDRLVLYTDGIVDAEDASGNDDSETRFSRVAAASRSSEPQEMLDAIFMDVSTLSAGQFNDDATLIVAAVD